MKFFTLLALSAILSSSVLAAGPGLPAELRRDGTVLRDVLDPVQKSLQDHSAVFYDSETRKYFIYGTVMSSDGYIFTKASELAGMKKFTVRIGKQHFRSPKLIAIDHRWDLALVKVEASGLKAVEWGSSDDLTRGTWVVSNGSTARRLRRVRPGVISANARKIEGPILVVLGVSLSDKDGKVSLNSVNAKSGAAKAGLQEGDIIVSLAGTKIEERKQILEILEDKIPGDVVKMEVLRGEETITAEVELMPRYDVFERQLTRNDAMSGIVSNRRENFPRVLQHDTTSSARSMGGPLVTLDGVCVGMNIACVDRVTAYAIPAEELQEAYQALRK